MHLAESESRLLPVTRRLSRLPLWLLAALLLAVYFLWVVSTDADYRIIFRATAQWFYDTRHGWTFGDRSYTISVHVNGHDFPLMTILPGGNETDFTLSLKALEPSLDLLGEAGIERLRAKSVHQTEYLIYLAEQWLYPLGFMLGSPRRVEQRGSHVSLRHPEGYRINRALIESPPPAVRVIPDFRAPDNIRLGVAPLYTSFEDLHRALDRIRVIVSQGIFRKYSEERLAVT